MVVIVKGFEWLKLVQNVLSLECAEFPVVVEMIWDGLQRSQEPTEGNNNNNA